MRILIMFVIISTFLSLLSKNDEENTIFSKDKDLFFLDCKLNYGLAHSKDNVSVEIDSITQEKYYLWNSESESINYVFFDSLKTIKVDSVVYVGSGEKSGVFLIIKEKSIIF